MPVQPSDDDFPDTKPRSSGSDLERFAEDSLGPGLAVAQGSLYFSAVEAGSEGRRRGKKLGVGAWIAIGWMVFIVVIAILSQAGALPVKSPTESFAECGRSTSRKPNGIGR